MATDNERQGELVLGNKQLLSIFFVMVVLLGVAFTIGYMIGKNTAAASAATTNVNPAPNPVRRQVEPPPDTGSEPAPVTEPPPASTRKAAAKPAPVTEPETPKPAAVSNTVGPYLQVAALKRQDAEHIVNVLKERGYPALLGESPKEGLFRVLVGPFKDMAELHDTKDKLKKSGFDTIVAR